MSRWSSRRKGVRATPAKTVAATIGVACALSGLVLMPATGSTPLAIAHPDSAIQFVGLGDSYAAGLGSGHYDKASKSCYRSRDAYAVQDSQQLGAALTFVACSGATTSDVEADQLSDLSPSTDDVSLTVGGNDIGFSDVIEECALPSWASHCFSAINHAEKLMRSVLPGSLDTLYSDIAADAPDAQVVVVGYPRLFNGDDCDPLTFFSKKEMTRLNLAANLLDRTIADRAHAHHFAFVNPIKAFIGHAVCSKHPWLHGLTYPVRESFHPTPAGQDAFAKLSVADF